MFKTLLTLAAAGNLAIASPVASRQVTPNYPPSSSSPGFILIANVTDPSTDLTPSVQGWQFGGIHTGAGLNDAVLTAGNNSGQIFYHNGTAEQIEYGQGSVLTDEGAQPFPCGIVVATADEFDYNYPGEHDVSINAGTGTIGVSFDRFPDPYFPLTATGQGTYAACPRIVPYYNAQFIVVRYSYATFNETTALYDYTVPEGCTAINLIPQCAQLNTLPANGSLSSHEYAEPQQCYQDFYSIDWPMYGP
ncbi:hypothetical protein F5Y16DRAFT_394482 [Xylariaceae sp. FL0255]|nr:hypothetical protein F5Y16DRAFT_394482 [Xylariaceae sp. FL0255]